MAGFDAFGSTPLANTPINATELAKAQYAQKTAPIFNPNAKADALAAQAQRQAAAQASAAININPPTPDPIINNYTEMVIENVRFNDYAQNSSRSVYAFPSSPARKFRIDTIETPGIEYEQLKFKGRSLFSFHVEFRTWTDEGVWWLTDFVKKIVPPLSDTGVKMVAPKVIRIFWQPTLDQGIKNFTVVDDDGIVTYNEQGRYYTWGVTFKQFAQWKGPGVLPYHSAVAGDLGNAPIVNPTDPSSQQPNTTAAALGIGVP